MLKTFNAKLPGMRKTVDWIVYPANEKSGNDITIQSDHRICQFDKTTGEGYISKHMGNGAYFVHLLPFMGATKIVVPPDVIALAVGVQPKTGDQVGPGVVVG